MKAEKSPTTTRRVPLDAPGKLAAEIMVKLDRLAEKDELAGKLAAAIVFRIVCKRLAEIPEVMLSEVFFGELAGAVMGERHEGGMP